MSCVAPCGPPSKPNQSTRGISSVLHSLPPFVRIDIPSVTPTFPSHPNVCVDTFTDAEATTWQHVRLNSTTNAFPHRSSASTAFQHHSPPTSTLALKPLPPASLACCCLACRHPEHQATTKAGLVQGDPLSRCCRSAHHRGRLRHPWTDTADVEVLCCASDQYRLSVGTDREL
jgi:hypothetical protein